MFTILQHWQFDYRPLHRCTQKVLLKTSLFKYTFYQLKKLKSVAGTSLAFVTDLQHR